MKRELEVLWKFFRIRLEEEMVYRLNFLLLLSSFVIYDLFGPVLTIVVYQVSKGFPGWSFWEALVLQASAIIVEELWFFFGSRVLFELERAIASGKFDFYLARPLSPLFLLFSSSCFPYGLFTLFVGIFILGYALPNLPITLISLLFYLLFLGSGFLFLLSLTILFSSISVFVVRNRPLRNAIFMLILYGKYPTNIFPKVFRIIFTFILPISLIAYFPAKAVLGKLFGVSSLIPFSISVLFFVISLLSWKVAIKKYSSAGG